jgi:hypothetical protein
MKTKDTKTPTEIEIEQEEELFFSDRKNLKAREKSIVRKKSTLREETIEKQYNLFMQKQKEGTRDSVYLNKVILKAAVTSYYYDIHKFKDFSGSEWANKNKQAAYTIKWIVKFHPIQIKENTKYITEEIFDINLKFALVCGFAFLGKEIIDLIMKNKQKTDSQIVDKENDKKETCFYDCLLYDLRYRHLSGKKLILAFEALELAVK